MYIIASKVHSDEGETILLMLPLASEEHSFYSAIIRVNKSIVRKYNVINILNSPYFLQSIECYIIYRIYVLENQIFKIGLGKTQRHLVCQTI